jgi:branched-chain amino acid transport system substrate-binding protein
MKKIMVSIMLVSIILTGCDKDDEKVVLPAEINQIIGMIHSSDDSLNIGMAAATSWFSINGIDTVQVRDKLVELYSQSTFAKEFVYTTPQGILQMIEPPAYYHYQGIDISNQAHVISAFETKLPVLSNSFMVVEGYLAVVDIQPVVNNNEILGAISIVFEPADLLSRLIEPVVSGQDFEIWVMEKTGVVLYDQDEAEIGLNVITDPLYQEYPGLIAACELMATEEYGETRYSFYQTGTTNVVTKKTYWHTFSMHGNEWKIVWAQSE